MSNEIRIFGVFNFNNSNEGLYLNQMADKFDTSVFMIQDANNIEDANKIRKDRNYLIPVELEDLAELNVFLDSADSRIDDPDIEYIAIEKHKPQKGKGLDSFCKKYDMTREQFYKLNPDFDSSNPNYIDANTEYNTIRKLTDDDIELKFGVNVYNNTNDDSSSDVLYATTRDINSTINTTAQEKDLRYGYLEDNFERGEFIIEAGSQIPTGAQIAVDEKLNAMGHIEKDKNINSVKDDAYNWTLTEYGYIDPNYDPHFDRGDVFVTCEIREGVTVGSIAFETGYNEDDIASINGLSNPNKIQACHEYTFEVNPDDIYDISRQRSLFKVSTMLFETVDTRKIPEGEYCKISDYIKENGIDKDRFYFYNKHLKEQEYLYGNQIVVVPIEHPAFRPDTYTDSNGNDYKIEKPYYVDEEKRRLYEAQMAPLAYGNNGIVPTKLFTSQEEYEQALYRDDYSDEIIQTMEKYKDTGIYDSYQDANYQILRYYGIWENRKNLDENVPSLDCTHFSDGTSKYEFRANGADFEYDIKTLYKLIGIDLEKKYFLNPGRVLLKNRTPVKKDKDGREIKRDENVIYKDTCIEIDGVALDFYNEKYRK